MRKREKATRGFNYNPIGNRPLEGEKKRGTKGIEEQESRALVNYQRSAGGAL